MIKTESQDAYDSYESSDSNDLLVPGSPLPRACRSRKLSAKAANQRQGKKAKVTATAKRITYNPEISEEKRERNRLAAEKYRQKGRDLLNTLEEKCMQLSQENCGLKSRNNVLQEEVEYLRRLVSRQK